MFFVGYICWPPTIGSFSPATADITASPIRVTTTKILRFICEIPFGANLLARSRYARPRHLDFEIREMQKKARSPKAARRENCVGELMSGSHRHYFRLSLFGAIHVHLVRLINREQHRHQQGHRSQPAHGAEGRGNRSQSRTDYVVRERPQENLCHRAKGFPPSVSPMMLATGAVFARK